MIYCEALLTTILFFTLFYTVRADMKMSIIENKKILLSGVACIVINAVYYCLFAGEYFLVFVANFIAMAVVSIILYAYNIWAAGDSKLLISVVLAIPGRFYYINYRGLTPGFLLLIAIFTFAYIYIVGESLYLWWKNRAWHNQKLSRPKVAWPRYIKNVLAITMILFAVNSILTSLFTEFFAENNVLLLMIAFAMMLTIIHFEALRSVRSLIISSIACLLLILVGMAQITVISINVWSYVALFVMLILRSISGKYNYREIKIADIKPGMILALRTVISFTSSRVQGLPMGTTEDLRSRLSVEEVESIKKWRTSVKGTETITIVRKIPFAVFIAVGTIVFLVFEVVV
jgi:hypothetical protein